MRLPKNVDTLVKQFPIDVAGEVDGFIQELIDVIVTTSDEIESALSEDWENFVDEDFTSVSYHKTLYPKTIQNVLVV